MFMTNKPPRYLLADHILWETHGKSLCQWVFEHRKRLQPVSWAVLTERLASATDGQVSVTQLTLRAWFADEIEAEHQADELASSEASADGRVAS